MQQTSKHGFKALIRTTPSLCRIIFLNLQLCPHSPIKARSFRPPVSVSLQAATHQTSTEHSRFHSHLGDFEILHGKDVFVDHDEIRQFADLE